MTRGETRSSSRQRHQRIPVQESIFAAASESFVWRCDDYPMTWSVWNRHPEVELHVIRRSTGTCQVGDFIGPFKPGDVYLVGGNLPHNWVTPLQPGDVVAKRDIVLQFDQDRLLGAADFLPELSALKELFDRAGRGIAFHGEARRTVAQLVEEMGGAQGLERISLLLRSLQILSATDQFNLLSSQAYKPNLDAKANGVLRAVLEHVSLHYADNIRLADLSDLAGMTEPSFSRFFKKMTGNTFTRYLTELRTARACELLIQTTKSITEICSEVGYFNLSNFNRAFRSVRGMSPGRYRTLGIK